MVTPTPSFDAYYCISQPSISNNGSDNKTVAIIVLSVSVIVTAGIIYYSITENKRLKQMIEDMKSRRI
jgi:hypothetical protein